MSNNGKAAGAESCHLVSGPIVFVFLVGVEANQLIVSGRRHNANDLIRASSPDIAF